MTNNKQKPLPKQQVRAKYHRQGVDDWLDEDIKPREPVLRFCPTAWAKLLYLRDKTNNEVGGFGITDREDLLFVRDLVIVKQEVTCVSVKFDDTAVGEFFDTQVDLGRKPEQFARLWLHTHPGDSPEPSGVDEDTFERVFGNCQWAVLFVLAQDDSTYARLSFHVGPGGQILIPTQVDYSGSFGPTDYEAWDAEYAANVKASDWLAKQPSTEPEPIASELCGCGLPYDFIDKFESMELAQRQLILDELAERPDLWDQESEVMLI